MGVRELVREVNADIELLSAEFDPALLGTARRGNKDVAAYDKDIVLAILRTRIEGEYETDMEFERIVAEHCGDADPVFVSVSPYDDPQRIISFAFNHAAMHEASLVSNVISAEDLRVMSWVWSRDDKPVRMTVIFGLCGSAYVYRHLTFLGRVVNPTLSFFTTVYSGSASPSEFDDLSRFEVK